jgi:hypothetical protein
MSVRHYVKKDIPADALEKINEVRRQDSSAGNRRPRFFVINTDYEIKKRTIKRIIQSFYQNSPVVIVGCAM